MKFKDLRQLDLIERREKMKHSEHSRQRVTERVGAGFKLIRHKLARRDYLGLPRQSLNKRVSLVKLDNELATVVIWSKNANKIITVLTPDQYIKRFGDTVPERVRLELLKYCGKERKK
jgi:non-homologous end joining protein Ku